MTARASLFTDHWMSGLPMCSKYRHFKTIWEQTFWQFSQIPFLLLWIVGYQGMELILCAVAGLFCSPAHNIAPHISLHDLPYHRTMRRCLRQVSLNKVTFLLLLQRIFCNCPQHLCSFRILVEYNPNKHGQRMMSVRPKKNVFHEYLPHWVNILHLPSQFYIVHIHSQE